MQDGGKQLQNKSSLKIEGLGERKSEDWSWKLKVTHMIKNHKPLVWIWRYHKFEAQEETTYAQSTLQEAEDLVSLRLDTAREVWRSLKTCFEAHGTSRMRSRRRRRITRGRINNNNHKPSVRGAHDLQAKSEANEVSHWRLKICYAVETWKGRWAVLGQRRIRVLAPRRSRPSEHTIDLCWQRGLTL